jgi:outer membrane protein assembly factor BamB
MILAGTTVVGAYVGTEAGTLFAFDAATGHERWTFQATGRGIRGAPTVANETVYFGSRDGHVYAVDATTGAGRWAFETGSTHRSELLASPTVVDGAVYVGNGDRTVSAVDATTGEKQWQTDIEGRVYANAAVENGTVYVGDYAGLHALDADNGDKQWVYETSEQVRATSPIVDGTIYVGLAGDNQNPTGSIHAVDTTAAEGEFSMDDGDGEPDRCCASGRE